MPAADTPDLPSLPLWGSFPAAKGQPGHSTQHGTAQGPAVQTDSCPEVTEKRLAQEALPGRNGLQDTPAEQWREPHSPLATVREAPGNAWAEELDAIPASRIPVDRISTSGQAGVPVNVWRRGQGLSEGWRVSPACAWLLLNGWSTFACMQ